MKRLVVTLAVGAVMFGGAACAHKQKRDTEQSRAHTDLAAQNFKLSQEASLEELRKALELDPENPDAWNLRGLVSLRQGSEIVDQAEVSTCLKGADAASLRRDATQKFVAAKDDFLRAVQFRPEYSEAWNNLAVAALQLQDWDLAIEAAANALKDVTYRQPYIARANLGWAYYHKKDVQGAWKELYNASVQVPDFCVGHFRLAKVYMERKDYEQARQEIDGILGRKDKDGKILCPIQEAYLLAGLVHDHLKDRDRASDSFANCVQLAPRSCVAAECQRFAQMTQ